MKTSKVLAFLALVLCIKTHGCVGENALSDEEDKVSEGIIVGVIGNSTQHKGPLGTIVTITNVEGILPQGVQAYPLEPAHNMMTQILTENLNIKKNFTN